MSDGSWPDVRKPSVPNETNKLTAVRQHQEHERRQSGSDMADGSKQCWRKVDECFGKTVQITCESSCEPETANASTLSAIASGSSTGGQARLTTSLLFELPEARRGSTSCSDDRMPAISKAQMKGT